MADPFVAEIRIFPFDFAPINWALCAGQILSISQNAALFSLIGTYYGGDGRSNFGLPDLRGNVPVGQGQGAGLSLYEVGEMGGSPTVALLDANNPVHNHSVNATTNNASTTDPTNNVYAAGVFGTRGAEKAINLYTTAAPGPTLKSTALNSAGGNQSHNNMMPYLVLNFCICMVGVYPSRS
jgi:microcystin-dependent protein